MTLLLEFTFFVLLLISGMPMAFNLGILSLISAYFIYNLPLSIIVERQISGLDQFTLIAVPLFILAGNVMTESGMTNHLVLVCKALVGRIRGGLAHTTILTCMIVAGMTGSDLADASASGSVMIPAMRRAGYPKAFGAAVVSAAAACGPLIPPSVPFVIYASITQTSIGALFLGGAIPGVLLGVYLMVAASIVAKIRHFPLEPAMALSEMGKAFGLSVPILVMPVIILGGIFVGIFTPTEASAIGVAYAVLVGVCLSRTLNRASIAQVLLDSMKTSASSLFIVAMAAVFSWMITLEQVGPRLEALLASVTSSPVVFLLLVNLAFLLLGCVMESIPIMLIFVPILFPVASAYGIDPVHFGVVVTLNLMMGLSTPPFGLSMFLVCRMAGVNHAEFTREFWPFFIAQFACLLTITFFPITVLFLPRLLMAGVGRG